MAMRQTMCDAKFAKLPLLLVLQQMKAKHKHWCGFPGDYGLKGPPVLDFVK